LIVDAESECHRRPCAAMAAKPERISAGPMAKKLTDGSFELRGAGPAPAVLLDAAQYVFGERGFSSARAEDALRLAGVGADSCGYGSALMDGLFVTLYQQHHAAHAAAARTAVAQARGSGVSDAGQLFEAGARAFLEGSWLRRDLALLFSSGDAPQGFAAIRKRHRCAWLRRNAVLLGLDDSPEDRLYVATLTSVIGGGGREVAAASDFRQARAMIDAVIGYTRLLAAGRPRPGIGCPRS
jgi:hypothetical protein